MRSHANSRRSSQKKSSRIFLSDCDPSSSDEKETPGIFSQESDEESDEEGNAAFATGLENMLMRLYTHFSESI